MVKAKPTNKRRLDGESLSDAGKVTDADEVLGNATNPETDQKRQLSLNVAGTTELARPLVDGKLTFVVHNWRPVNPYDMSEDPAQDLKIDPGETVSL